MATISRPMLIALALASLLAVIDLFVAFLLFLGTPSILVLPTAASYLILEFGIMLILGSCMMSRSPLDDEKRLDESGNEVSAWKWAQRGKLVLISSAFTLFFGILFAVIGGML